MSFFDSFAIGAVSGQYGRVVSGLNPQGGFGIDLTDGEQTCPEPRLDPKTSPAARLVAVHRCFDA
jgi:hypothetical protein